MIFSMIRFLFIPEYKGKFLQEIYIKPHLTERVVKFTFNM